MERQVTFDGDNEADKALVALAFRAFNERGTPEQGKRLSKDEHRSEKRVKLALYAITEPVSKEDLKPGEPDLRPRELCSGPQTLALDQPDFKRLQDYVESYQWPSMLTDLACDLADRLEVAKKFDGGVEQDAVEPKKGKRK